MNADDYAGAVIMNVAIWGLAYKISQEGGHDAYLILGAMASILYTLLNKYQKARHKNALKLIRNEALQEELAYRAREAYAAITAEAEQRRKTQLGYGTRAELEKAEAHREVATDRFYRLQGAAYAVGNPLVKASIKDYLEVPL